MQEIIKAAPLDGDPCENQTVLRLISGLMKEAESNPEHASFLKEHTKNIAGVVVRIIVDEKCDSTESGRKMASKLLKELVQSEEALAYI